MAETASTEVTSKWGSVPLYAALGQACRDILDKDYILGKIKFEAKGTTNNGVALNGGVTYFHEEDKIGANAGAKFQFKSIDFQVKANADNLGKDYSLEDNTVIAEASVRDQHLKATVDCSVNPKSGNLAGNLKAEFSDEATSCNLYTKLEENAPLVIDGAVVVSYRDILAGYRLCYDTDSRQLKENNFGLQYGYKDFIFHASTNNDDEFTASVCYKPPESYECGGLAKWSRSSNETYCALGTKIDLNDRTSVKLKVDNLFGMGIGLKQRFRHDITVVLSALIDCQNIGSSGNHRFGAGVEITL